MSDLNRPARVTLLDRWFFDHPASVDETYAQHLKFALGIGFWLLAAGGAAVLHALVPALCETTASRILRRLMSRMETRD